MSAPTAAIQVWLNHFVLQLSQVHRRRVPGAGGQPGEVVNHEGLKVRQGL